MIDTLKEHLHEDENFILIEEDAPPRILRESDYFYFFVILTILFLVLSVAAFIASFYYFLNDYYTNISFVETIKYIFKNFDHLRSIITTRFSTLQEFSLIASQTFIISTYLSLVYVIFRKYIENLDKMRITKAIHYKQPLKLKQSALSFLLKKDFDTCKTNVKICDYELGDDTQTKHMTVVGQTGGGKTTILKHVIYSACQNAKVIVYDPKNEFVEWLPAPKLYLVNVFDKRSVALDLNKDIETLTDAKAVANALAEKSGNNSSDFFEKGGVAIVASVIFALKKRNKLTAQNIIKEFSNTKTLFQTARFGDPMIDSVLGITNGNNDEVPEAAKNFVQNAAQIIEVFRYLADIELVAKEKLSIKDFVHNDEKATIVLSGYADKKHVETAIARYVVAIATMQVVQRKDTKPGDYALFFILDEFAQLKRIDQIQTLLEVGRSKGARVVLGLQNFAQLDEIYGRDKAKTIKTQPQTRIFTRLSAEDADEISKNLGNRTFYVRNINVSNRDSDNESISDSFNRVSEQFLTQSDFLNLTSGSSGAEVIILINKFAVFAKQRHLKTQKLREQYVPIDNDSLEKTKKEIENDIIKEQLFSKAF